MGVLDQFLLYKFPAQRVSFTNLQLKASDQNLSDFPDELTTQKSINAYDQSSLRLVFPVFEPGVFQETVTKAYGPPAYPGSNAAAKACVWALHAITDHFQCGRNPAQLMYSEMCATKAQTLLGLVGEEPSLDALQAVLLLVS